MSLEAALAELDAKRFALKELEQVKADTQDKLKEARDSLQALQAERQADNSAAMLEAVQGEVVLIVSSIDLHLRNPFTSCRLPEPLFWLRRKPFNFFNLRLNPWKWR